jgi:hypothetical protein
MRGAADHPRKGSGGVLATTLRQGNDRTMATMKSAITPQRGHRWSGRPYNAGNVTPQSSAPAGDTFVPYRVVSRMARYHLPKISTPRLLSRGKRKRWGSLSSE